MSQPQTHSESSVADSLDTTLVIVDDFEDAVPQPRQLSPQELLERRRILDSYSIEPEKLAKLKQAAIRLGRSKAELIREGVELILEKYRDKLGDLPDPESPNGDAKPENGPSSR
jgi:hypothetical protein